jgi:hypothetical protein
MRHLDVIHKRIVASHANGWERDLYLGRMWDPASIVCDEIQKERARLAEERARMARGDEQSGVRPVDGACGGVGVEGGGR